MTPKEQRRERVKSRLGDTAKNSTRKAAAAFASAASAASFGSFELVAALSSLAFAPQMGCCQIRCSQDEERTMHMW